MEDALARYLRWHKSVGHSVRTIEWHRCCISWFIDYLRAQGRPLGLADLHVDDVRAWLTDQQARGLSAYSLSSRVRSLKAWTRWLVDEDWLSADPLRRLQPPRVDDAPKDVLTPADVDKLLAVCDPRALTGTRDRAIMLLLYSTGMRAGELIRLRAEDLNTTQGTLMIRRAKSRKFRVVPLGPKVEKAIARYLHHPARLAVDDAPLFLTRAGEPLTINGLRMILRRRGAQAGVKANPHKWRHSAAIQYLRAGGRVETLQQLLGHSTIAMTLHYARLTVDDVAAGHESADPTRALKTKI
jgi:site-specific recombinase XerD